MKYGIHHPLKGTYEYTEDESKIIDMVNKAALELYMTYTHNSPVVERIENADGTVSLIPYIISDKPIVPYDAESSITSIAVIPDIVQSSPEQ